MHPLEGPRLKVQCAHREIETILNLDLAMQKETTYRVVRAEYDSDRQKHAYRVLMDVLPPLVIGVLIGEIAHNLRSALDGLTWQLALLGPKAPEKNTMFPIFTVRQTKRRQKSGDKIPHFAEGGLRRIRSLRLEHQQDIESLQPYKGGHGFRQHPLYLLSELNNADKHRLLPVVGAFGGAFIFYQGAGTAPLPFDELRKAVELVHGPLKDGAIVGYAPTSLGMNISIQPSISFAGGCAAVKGLGVRMTLFGIANHVAKIIESFEPEFA